MSNKPIEFLDLFDNNDFNKSKLTRCKFVVLESDRTLHFIFGPLDPYSYHADLVNKFCDLNEIDSHWVEKPYLLEILDLSYKIKGGGWIDANNETSQLQVYGYSTAYGAYSVKEVAHIIDQSELMANYQVSLN